MAMHHELITLDLRTTSRVVAEKFGKRHDNVLRDITKIQKEVPPEFNALNFEAVEYLDPKGEARPMFELTRDGFVLLAMGFTGAAAMEWKVRFIEAFNLMEAEIRDRAAAKAAPRAPDLDDMPLGVSSLRLSLTREARHLFGVVAARKLWRDLGMPHVEAPERDAPEEAHSPLEQFLTQWYEITGQPGDRVSSAEMWQSFQDWSTDTGAAPLSQRAFHIRLVALTAIWRCPATGRRIGRIKANSIYYTGLIPIVG